MKKMLLMLAVNIYTMSAMDTTHNEKSHLLNVQHAVQTDFEQPPSVYYRIADKLNKSKNSFNLHSSLQYITNAGLGAGCILALADQHIGSVVALSCSVISFFATLITDKIASDRFNDFKESVEDILLLPNNEKIIT